MCSSFVRIKLGLNPFLVNFGQPPFVHCILLCFWNNGFHIHSNSKSSTRLIFRNVTPSQQQLPTHCPYLIFPPFIGLIFFGEFESCLVSRLMYCSETYWEAIVARLLWFLSLAAMQRVLFLRPPDSCWLSLDNKFNPLNLVAASPFSVLVIGSSRISVAAIYQENISCS